MMSSGPKSLGVFFLNLFFFHLSFLFFCVQWELHLVQDVGDELVPVLWRVLLFSRSHPVFLTRPTCSHLIPHIPSVLPPPFVLPSCAVFWILFHHSCRDCHHLVLLHLYTVFRESRTAFVFVTNPSHGAPQAFRNLFIQKGQPHLHPYLSGHDACSCLVLNPRLSVFSVGIILSLSVFPGLKSFPMSAVSTTSFHFHRRTLHAHGPPIADILSSTGCPYSCIS